jgi:putative redox protein
MASLGSCIGSVLAYYADWHRMNLEGMMVDLDWQIVEEPHRIGSIAVSVTLPLALPEAQLTALRRVADSCLIHNTLLHPPKIRTTVVGKQ